MQKLLILLVSSLVVVSDASWSSIFDWLPFSGRIQFNDDVMFFGQRYLPSETNPAFTSTRPDPYGSPAFSSESFSTATLDNSYSPHPMMFSQPPESYATENYPFSEMPDFEPQPPHQPEFYGENSFDTSDPKMYDEESPVPPPGLRQHEAHMPISNPGHIDLPDQEQPQEESHPEQEHPTNPDSHITYPPPKFNQNDLQQYMEHNQEQHQEQPQREHQQIEQPQEQRQPQEPHTQEHLQQERQPPHEQQQYMKNQEEYEAEQEQDLQNDLKQTEPPSSPQYNQNEQQDEQNEAQELQMPQRYRNVQYQAHPPAESREPPRENDRRNEYAEYADIYKYSWKDSDKLNNPYYSRNERPPFQPPAPTFKSMNANSIMNEQTGSIPVAQRYPSESLKRSNYIVFDAKALERSESQVIESRVNATSHSNETMDDRSFNGTNGFVMNGTAVNFPGFAIELLDTQIDRSSQNKTNSVTIKPRPLPYLYRPRKLQIRITTRTPSMRDRQLANNNPLRNLFKLSRERPDINATSVQQSTTTTPVIRPVIRFSG